MESAKSVYFRVIREDEEVIHIDDEPSFGNHVLEGVIYEPLKGGRGVAKSKEHDGWLEKPFMSNEGGLPLVSIFDVDIVISRPDIHLSEDRGPFQFVNEVRYQGFLSYKEEQGCLG